MKKRKLASMVIYIIGSLSVLAGIYEAFTDGDFQSWFFSIFIGVTLIGAAYLSAKGEADSDIPNSDKPEAS